MRIKITGTYTVPVKVVEYRNDSIAVNTPAVAKEVYKPYTCSVNLVMDIDDKDIKSLLANQKSLFQHVFGDK